MCFGNDKLSKTLLEHSLKSTVSELPLRVNILRVQITCEIDRRKISSLGKLDILGVFSNTLSANDKDPVWDCENLSFPIQTQLS